MTWTCHGRSEFLLVPHFLLVMNKTVRHVVPVDPSSQQRILAEYVEHGVLNGHVTKQFMEPSARPCLQLKRGHRLVAEVLVAGICERRQQQGSCFSMKLLRLLGVSSHSGRYAAACVRRCTTAGTSNAFSQRTEVASCGNGLKKRTIPGDDMWRRYPANKTAALCNDLPACTASCASGPLDVDEASPSVSRHLLESWTQQRAAANGADWTASSARRCSHKGFIIVGVANGRRQQITGRTCNGCGSSKCHQVRHLACGDSRHRMEINLDGVATSAAPLRGTRLRGTWVGPVPGICHSCTL